MTATSSTSRSRLTLATRGSRLALTQAETIAEMVRAARPGIEIELRTVKTTGDKDARPFSSIGGKGLFIAEVEREVVEGRADFAVHSAKDLTAELADGCVIVCVPPRAAVFDVVVGGRGRTGEDRIASLPSGSRVGTSSIRRRSLLAEMRDDLEVVDFRGNIDTRLKKVADGVVDVAIIAAAGIERLGADADAGPLDPERWVPAPAQGALAVEARLDNDEVAELFVGLGDPDARSEVNCERAFAQELEGGCSVPLGCLARADGVDVVATGYLGHPSGMEQFRDRASGSSTDAEALGRELARAILAAGGDAILDELRDSTQPTPSPS